MARQKSTARSCTKCCNLLPASEFAMTPKGNCRRECRACFVPGPQNAVCQKCTRTLPLEEFAFHVSINGTKRRRLRCKQCVKQYCTSFKCSRCKEVLSRDAFPRSLNGNRARACFECAEARSRQLLVRPCRACGRKKAKSEFYTMLGGGYSSRCRTCIKLMPGSGPPLRKLDDACLHCGNEMWTACKAERTQGLQYCRRTCEKAGRIKDTQSCVSCGKLVGKADYPVFLDRAKRKNFRCRKCVVAIREGRDILFRSSLSLRKVRYELHRQAKRNGETCHVGIGQLREMAQHPCVLCGGLTETVVLQAEGLSIEMSNLRPVCSYCRAAKGKKDLDDIVGWAQRIATHHGYTHSPVSRHPAGPKVPEKSKALIREFTRGADPKKALKRNSPLIPPQIFEDRAMDETFEQRLARHAKVRQAGDKEES